MYELSEDGSEVPELVAGVRLSYVHLFGFLNEYFSVVYAVVFTVLAICVASNDYRPTHLKFLNYPFSSCMGLFCDPC
jgi:hypothetical protein